jgi:peptide/nickel transport system permease protein
VRAAPPRDVAPDTLGAGGGQAAVAGSGFDEVTARSHWRMVLRRFRRHRMAMAGTFFLALTSLACFVGARFGQDPNLQHLLEPTSGPSTGHWFGTDEISRDVFARVLHGGQISLRVALGVAVVSTAIGTAIGALAGYYGGRIDNLLMRLVDLVLTIPLLPLLIVAASIGTLGPLQLGSPLGITLILSLFIWTLIARVVRGVFLSLREKEFVEAALALGASDARIIVRHMLPNTVGPIIVNATLTVATAILLESTLSFLGFGVNPPTPTWGNMLSNSISTMELYPWLTFFPGAAIFLTVLAVNFVGDGLRDAFDPTQTRVRA